MDVVILGAGYGGMSCVTRLSRRFRRDPDVRIHLVDRHTYHLLETRLHERAVREAEVTIPISRFIRKRTNLSFHLGEITRIDLDGRCVELDGVSRFSLHAPRTVRYDRLVIALGSKTNFYQIPGLEQHAFQLKTLEDSERIRAHTERMFAFAAAESNRPLRREYLRFLIGGGGLTGVELAGELAGRVESLCRDYHILPDETEVVVVERSDRLLPSLDERQAHRVEGILQGMGIRILTSTRVMGMVEQDGRLKVLLNPGDPLYTRTMVWTGGIRISDLVKDSRAETGPHGRIVVDPFLQVIGYPGVFAIGDNSLAKDPSTGAAVPTAAQFALQQGYHTADNLVRSVRARSLRPYRPRVLGEVISLGRHLAVGWAALPAAGRIRFIGFLASLLKRAISERHLFLLWKERQNWAGWW